MDAPQHLLKKTLRYSFREAGIASSCHFVNVTYTEVEKNNVAHETYNVINRILEKKGQAAKRIATITKN